MIHVVAAAANEKSSNSNGRSGDDGNSTGRGDIVILALAGGVGHTGGNVSLAIANEFGTISIRIHEQLGHELFPGEEPILIAPRLQSVRCPEGVSAVLRAVAVPTAGPRAQIDLLGLAVLIKGVLVGQVVDLGIARVEADPEHGVGRGGIHAAEGDGRLDGDVLAEHAVSVVGVAVEGGRGGRDGKGRVALEAGDGNVRGPSGRGGSEKEQRRADGEAGQR